MYRLLLFTFLITIQVNAQLNSSFDEQNPILTPDGTELYFTISNHPQNISGKRDLGDVWFSELVDGKWSAPTTAKGLINNGGYNAVLGFSQDGNEMYLYGHYSANGNLLGSQGISVSKRSAGGWSLPRNEEVPYFLNRSINSGGYIAPDKSVFILSADSRGTLGNEDLYVSFNENDKWTEPKHLGSIVNTKNQELTPWLSSNKKTIYFSSNSTTSMGSFDVFSSDRLDDSWTNWSPPKNLGLGINSEGKELSYHTFPGKTFFTSTHNSDGYGDIIERDEINVQQAEPITTAPRAKPTVPTKQETVMPVQEKSGFMLYGKVLSSSNNQGVMADLVFNSTTPVKTQTQRDGSYKVALDPTTDYNVSIEAKGFIGVFEKVDIPKRDLHELEINFRMQPITVGASMNLRNLLFRQSSPELLPESHDELEMVFDFLQTNPTVEIELSGHTDNAGKASLNMKLSRDRVIRVKNYLVEKGIDARRIKGVGYGETKPIASNKTDAGRKLNRRVEFKILKE